jgi:DNA-binding CsgD family transcriptional regulator
MQDLALSGHELSALRALMAMEPIPGQPLPGVDVLDRLDALVPCDELAIGYSDMTGLLTALVTSHPSGSGRRTFQADVDLHVEHGGPFYLGVMHWRLFRQQAEDCGVPLGLRDDAVSVGFRNGTDHIVQYDFTREGSRFTPRELAIIDLLGPVMQRLARERPTPGLPATLTITERRMLCEVAAGLSNAEIAGGNSIAVSTVRKHLENAYRKLGVTNRVAAIARLRGSDQPGLDLRERVERYA